MEIAIGSRSVPENQFVTAVKNSRSVRQVCDNIGFNSNVSTTLNYIKEQIANLGLDTAHFKKEYTCDHEAISERRLKTFTLSKDNEIYFEAFKASVSDTSWFTYKATVGNFLEGLNKDFATVTPEEILSFTENKPNRNAHIRSMMIYCVNNNINDAVEKVSKQTLIWLIGSTAKK